MAFLVAITGPPGAGKSTVAGLLSGEFEKSALIEGDAFFGFLARGAVEPWLPAAHRQNEVITRAAAAAAGGYVAGGYITVYDGILGPWFLADFAAATTLDYLHYAVLLPSADRCVAQLAGRTGHGFTDEAATRHMHRQFAEPASTSGTCWLSCPVRPMKRRRKYSGEFVTGRCVTHS